MNFIDIRNKIVRQIRKIYLLRLWYKYKNYTMAPFRVFWSNMVVVDRQRHLEGCVIETGVWRGGMSAGMAEVLGSNRHYFLFDSFEGLPPASDRDGETAIKYQLDRDSPTYYNNCSAEIQYAQVAMKLSGANKVEYVKGWFDKTIPKFVPPEPIAVLRLDGDWYDSTMIVLQNLTQYLVPGGLIIIDDYYAWEGCSAAVHDFISNNKINANIHQSFGVCILSIAAPINQSVA